MRRSKGLLLKALGFRAACFNSSSIYIPMYIRIYIYICIYIGFSVELRSVTISGSCVLDYAGFRRAVWGVLYWLAFWFLLR